ncbi:MAG: hypothetical protein IPG34_15615 [Rhodocyclaceae bacterium]|nr:hypothetical protein [Rhodocyclaceae bacterium]
MAVNQRRIAEKDFQSSSTRLDVISVKRLSTASMAVITASVSADGLKRQLAGQKQIIKRQQVRLDERLHRRPPFCRRDAASRSSNSSASRQPRASWRIAPAAIRSLATFSPLVPGGPISKAQYLRQDTSAYAAQSRPGVESLGSSPVELRQRRALIQAGCSIATPS